MNKHILLFALAFTACTNAPQDLVLEPVEIKEEKYEIQESLMERTIHELFNDTSYELASGQVVSIFGDDYGALRLEIDEENYYAKIMGNWDGEAFLTIFIKPDGGQIAAVSTLGCGPMCRQTLNFFEKDGSHWKDITEDVFPALTESEISELEEESATGDFLGLYNLPQFGTEITYVNQYENGDEDQKVYYIFSWKDGHFVKTKL